MSPSSENLSDILSLFSILILVDGKVLPEEVVVMGNQLSKMVKDVDQNILLSPDMGRDWFVNNRYSLTLALSADNADCIADIAVMKLKDLEPKMKQKLIYAMIRISWSDGEFHNSENKLVNRASEIWGINQMQKMTAMSG